ncbi:MAG: diphthine--ammonia ligase [Methanomicrobiales archaeon]|nr:diphthine--ammonia ligase [Methanomicrobiales archaeon]
MSWAALTSGGKDSILAVQRAIDAGMEVTHLVTVRPANVESFMFHTSNLDAVPVIARLSGMEYVEIPSGGSKEEEVIDLEEGLSSLSVEGIITGAIASRYQLERIRKVADHLSLAVHSPLWGEDPVALLREVSDRLHAILVVVAADGLTSRYLGRRIDRDLIGELQDLAVKRGIHISGEGGEYETLTLNAPFYCRPLTYRSSELISSMRRSELILRGFE